MTLLSACTADVDDDGLIAAEGEEEDVAESEDAILQGWTQASFAGIVRAGCTATVLSEHWLLTAAHCLDHTPGQDFTVFASLGTDGNPDDSEEEKLYIGPVQYFPHAGNYVGDDVGLIRLLSYGIDTTAIGRAKLYSGSSTAPTSSMVIAGFGYGSASNGSLSCDSGTTLGILRSRSQTVAGSDSSNTIWANGHFHCHGDSGGPWMSQVFSGGTPHYIQFGVTSSSSSSTDYAAGIKGMRAWIESTMQSNPPHRFGFSTSPGTLGGLPYRTYNESGFILAPLEIGGWCVEPDGWGNGSPLVLRTCDGSDAQRWWLKATGEIRHPVANRCMDIDGAGTANGTKAHLWDCHGGRNQRFRRNADGSIHYGVDHDKCVDLQWGNFSDGSPLWLWDCNGSAAQSFEFAN